MMNYSERLHKVIPGGAHTYSRGDDQFPANAPQILERGKGCRVWSPDGREFIDYGMGLRSVNLGYGNEEVASAVMDEIMKGNNLTRASVTELTAAELLTSIIPSAEMVKFAKHGSTVTTAAVKLARAYTGRKYIAVPAEHPFFSFDDWFIGSTVMNLGVPDEIRSLTLRFHYNDLASLESLFQAHPGEIAAVILEPATTTGPCNDQCVNKSQCWSCSNHSLNFLHQVRALCKSQGTVFILDEMITGFRWHFQGAQTFYGIEPDLSTFGKAMANGMAVAALTGKREIMSIGGIQEKGKERLFLVSTTHGAEMGALGAFIKTMEILQREKVVEHMWRYGSRLMEGVNNLSQELGISEFFYMEGYPCSPNYIAKDRDGKVSLDMRTLFSQEMIANGVLMPYVAISMSHDDNALNQTLEAVKRALAVYAVALDKGVQGYLQGHSINPVFRKYN